MCSWGEGMIIPAGEEPFGDGPLDGLYSVGRGLTAVGEAIERGLGGDVTAYTDTIFIWKVVLVAS